MLTPEESELYRSLCMSFCDIAVGGTEGRRREDPVAQEVTEGHGGSSCGFLLHWVAFVLGVREPWVNRNSVTRYRQRKNLSLLFGATWGAKGPKCAQRLNPGDFEFLHGDFLIMENPAKPNDDHVCIVAKDYRGGKLLSYDYGQRGAGGKEEDGRFCERELHEDRSGYLVTRDGKRIWGRISLPELIAEARENGKLDDPTEPAQWFRSVSGITE